MAVESPADLVMIGLNRLSLEAGLYARFLGYQVTILGNDFSITRFANDSQEKLGESTTSLAHKALEAQGHFFDDSNIADLAALKKTYIEPLANSDLLSECWIPTCEKIKARLGESELPKELEDDVEYDTRIFELEVDLIGSESARCITADVLIDYRTEEEVTRMDFDPEFDLPKPLDSDDSDSLKRLITEIDDFYCLGDRRIQNLSFADGLAEIRDLFRILCDNPSLDLYSE